MAFGLCNTPATYARVISLVLRGLTWDIVLAFLDDILVLGKDIASHLANLRAVLQRFREYGLKLKPKKCELFQEQVEFLGRLVSRQGMNNGPGYIEDVKKWPAPHNTKTVERFLGFANYHRAFIEGYSKIAVPLQDVTGKRSFTWGEKQQEAFDKLREALTSAPLLTLPNTSDPFILDTDASDYAIGAVLSQVQNGEERVVCYASCTLTPEQRRYCTTRKELLAVVRFTRQFRHYLLGRNFVVRTDHSSLTWLLRFKQPQGQLARWLEELSQYHMEVRHRAGSKHINADALSRMPVDSPCQDFKTEVNLATLPCGGCPYCARAQAQWSKFMTDVDDVVPLASKGTGVGKRSVNEILVTGQNSDEVGFLDEIPVADPKPADEGICISRVTVATVGRDVVIVPDDPECSIRVVQDGLGVVLGKYSVEQICDAQSKDPEFKWLTEWPDDNSCQPAQGDLFRSSQPAKFYWTIKERFSRDERGMIMYHAKDGEGNRLLVPREWRRDIMELCHDIPSAGHQGMTRTQERVKQFYYWHGLKRDLEGYVASCTACNQSKKPNKTARCPMTMFHAGAPMERVHLDFVGPLPKSDRANEHLLMIVDQFSKWVECIPLPSQTAEVTARAAVNDFFCRFGYPYEIFTDQGRNFESLLFQSVCELLHIHKARTTPYRPSANGQVERFNRTLLASIRCFVGTNQKTWDLHIPQLAGAIRASVNRSTGFTPNRLMLGREVNLPAELMFRPPKTGQPPDLAGYVGDLEEALRSAHEIARANLKTSQLRAKQAYDLRVVARQYKVGDVVYKLDTASLPGKCKKLNPMWRGPGVILARISPYLYKVKMKKALTTVNHDRLKLCRDRELPVWVNRAIEELQNGGVAQAMQPNNPVTPSQDNVQDPVRVDQVPPTLQSTEGRKTNASGSTGALYCTCRGPYTGEFMISCDRCSEWYHGRCVGISPQEAEEWENQDYICSGCKIKPDPPHVSLNPTGLRRSARRKGSE